MPTSDELWRAKIEEFLDEMWRAAVERMRERCPENTAGLVRGAALVEFVVDAMRMLSVDGEANEHARMYALAVVERFDLVHADPEVQEASARMQESMDADAGLREPVN